MEESRMWSQEAVLLNAFFSRNTFRKILNQGESEEYNLVVDYCTRGRRGLSNEDCIREVYRYLERSYRNEYYYKNTLLIKYLFGTHSPNTTTALTELPVEDSIADLVMVGSESVVFEIKTGLDNFDRLKGQLRSYYRAFSKVCVVTAPECEESLGRRLHDTPVGILVLTPRGTLHKKKEPVEYREALSQDAMFRILRKKERDDILINTYGQLPEVSQFRYYKSCRSLFDALPIGEAERLFLRALRNRCHPLQDHWQEVPGALKFIAYFSDYREDDYNKLIRFLHETRRT